jgi:uncharacterized membrane protein YvbJ
VRTCPRCGQENPDEARFCLHCGGGLDPAPSLERARSILEATGARLYLPEVDALAAAG